MNIDTFHYLDIIRSILKPLPEVEEYSCFGTPAFRIKKKLLARIQEDGETIAVRCHNRDVWMKANRKYFSSPIISGITLRYWLDYPSYQKKISPISLQKHGTPLHQKRSLRNLTVNRKPRVTDHHRSQPAALIINYWLKKK